MIKCIKAWVQNVDENYSLYKEILNWNFLTFNLIKSSSFQEICMYCNIITYLLSVKTFNCLALSMHFR